MAAVEPSEEPSLAPELSAEVGAAQDALRRAVQAAGLANDPTRHALEALATHLGALHHLLAEGTLALAAQIRRAQRPVSDAGPHWLEQAAGAGAPARRRWRGTALAAAGALFGTALLFGGGGYLWGRWSALASVRETESGWAAMFRDGPRAAADWLDLATWNDPRQALAQCGSGNTAVQGGRKACRVPLWVEAPPKPTAP
jgi:hypothetical protein